MMETPTPAWPTPPEITDQPTGSKPQREPRKSEVFYGPFGLRAGWSLAIYLGIILSIVLGIRVIQKKLKPMIEAAQTSSQSKDATKPAVKKPAESKPQPVAAIILGETFVFAFFFGLSWLMVWIEKRRFSVFGLGGSHSVMRFLTGAVWGLIALSFLIAVLRLCHLVSFDARLDHGIGILGWGSALLVAFFLVGLTEEYMFRGYIQYTLTRGLVSVGNLISRKHARTIAFWIASVITSAIFFIAHTSNGGETKLGLFMVFMAGIVFVVALWRTGSLWWAIGFHTTWDWAQSFLYGVPDSGGLIQGRLFATHATGNPILSGGPTGPEGSALVIPVLLAIIAVLVFATSPSPQPPFELDATPSLPPGEQPTTA